MDIQELQEMHDQETSYWWHLGRRVVLDKLLHRFLLLRHGQKVLDVGCGTGVNFAWLHAWGQVHGLDNSTEALAFCKKQGAYDELIQGDASNFDTSHAYDLLTAFDVLEHLENDDKALTTWFKPLKSGGLIYITVPAYQWLYSAHDKALHHFRRYSTKELRDKLQKAGFKVRFISPFFTFTFPIVAVVRLLNKNKPAQTSYKKTSSWVANILVSFSRLEAWFLARGVRLPFGSSIVVVAEKNTESRI
jgi:SAM-dependent methyltransferase